MVVLKIHPCICFLLINMFSGLWKSTNLKLISIYKKQGAIKLQLTGTGKRTMYLFSLNIIGCRTGSSGSRAVFTIISLVATNAKFSILYAQLKLSGRRLWPVGQAHWYPLGIGRQSFWQRSGRHLGVDSGWMAGWYILSPVPTANFSPEALTTRSVTYWLPVNLLADLTSPSRSRQ